MVKAPAPEKEDRCRLCRERGARLAAQQVAAPASAAMLLDIKGIDLRHPLVGRTVPKRAKRPVEDELKAVKV